MRVYQRPPIGPVEYAVEERGYETSCWIWRGTPNNKGYGKVTIAGRVMFAHRALYEQEIGPIPSGLELDHLCRVPLCVRPDHLEPVAHAVNIRRGKNTKLSGEQVALIRSDPRSSYALAKELGVSASHVWRIRVGQKRRS